MLRTAPTAASTATSSITPQIVLSTASKRRESTCVARYRRMGKWIESGQNLQQMDTRGGKDYKSMEYDGR